MNIKFKNRSYTIFTTLILSVVCGIFVSCKSSGVEEEVFVKTVHPREYYFDLSEIDDSISLEKNKKTETLESFTDFTKFVEEDLPQAGDKLIFMYQAKYSNFKEMPGSIYASLEGAEEEKHVFASSLKRKDVVNDKVSFVIKNDLTEVKLKLVYEEPFKSSKIKFALEKVIDSTDTKAEKKAFEKAVKKGLKIVENKTEITDDYVKEIIKPEPLPEYIEEVSESKEEINDNNDNIEENADAQEKTEEEINNTEPEETAAETEQQEEIKTSEETDVSEKSSEIEENVSEDSPSEEDMEKAEDSAEEETLEENLEETAEEEAEQEKEMTPEEMIAEQQKILEMKQAELAAAQAKLEAEKAILEAERIAKEKEEQERLAEEAKRKAEQQEKERQENELLEHQKMLEETIQVITNSNVQRYEKEYLNDYAVSGYSFDMEEEEAPPPLFENPDKTDEFGRTLLMNAAKDGNDWKIKALINAGADVNARDNDGWTALMYAVRYHGNMNCVEILIKSGADIKARNNYGMTALLLTANYNSNPEILKKLLEYYSPAEKDVIQSFVQVLTENQDDEYMQILKVKLFLDKSVPLNSFYYGKTPLMYAAESGHSTKVIKLLLEGSNTAIRSKDGKTAFDYAKENPKLEHDDIYWSLNSK